MDSLTVLQQKYDALVEDAENALAAALDPENEAKKEGLLAKAKEYNDLAEAMKQDIELAETIQNRRKKAEKPRDGNIEPPKKEKVVIHATCRPHITTEFLRREVNGMDADHRAYAMGRWALGVASRTCPGLYGHFAPLAKAHEEAFGPMQAAKESGAAGVYVPEEFGTDLISNMKRYGISRNLLNVVSMFSDTRTDPKEGSDPTPVFVGEGVAGSDNTPTDDNTVRLTAKKLMAIIINSSELNEDAITEYGDSLMRRLSNGFANKEDSCAWNGDGTSTYGSIKGFTHLLNNISGTTDSAGLITGSGTTWASLTLGDFHKVLGAFPDFADSGPNESPDAVWVTHRAFYYEVMHSLMIAQGGATAEVTESGLTRMMFLGRPVVFSNVMPSTTALDSVVCTYGNHRRAANFGDRRAFTLSFSQDGNVGSVNLFETDQIGIKATERFDINVHSVGSTSEAGPVVGLKTAPS